MQPTIQFFWGKRMQSRRGSYTIKEVTQKLREIGMEPFHINPVFMGVNITTQEQRKAVHHALNMILRDFPYMTTELNEDGTPRQHWMGRAKSKQGE